MTVRPLNLNAKCFKTPLRRLRRKTSGKKMPIFVKLSKMIGLSSDGYLSRWRKKYWDYSNSNTNQKTAKYKNYWMLIEYKPVSLELTLNYWKFIHHNRNFKSKNLSRESTSDAMMIEYIHLIAINKNPI